MAAKQLMLPANRAFNSNGLAISGAQAKLYLSGGLTPANFFADSGLVTSLGATLTANGAGRFPTAYGDSTVAYRLRTLDSDGAVLDDIDPYFFGLTTGVDGVNASIAVGTTTTGAAGSNASVSNSGTGTNAILNFTVPAGASGPAGDVAKETDRTALAAITGQTSGATRFLVESGREGTFVWSTANNSANVTKDPQQGVYVAPASDTTGASGAWVRHPGIDNWKNVKWFGAKGDATAPGVGTDDHIALQAAITYGAAAGVALYAPRGAYRNSALLTSTAPIHFFGDYVSQDSTGTATPASILGSAIYSDAGVGGLLLYYVTNLTAAGSPTIYPSAAGSVIERIQFHSAGEGAAHAGVYGFESRAACTLRDVTVRGFGDHGVHLRGSIGGSDGVVFGNVNGSVLHNVKSIGNAGAGLRISGNDANSITVVGGLYQINTGYGIDNDSFLGCTFVNPICEGNVAGAIITRRPVQAANTYIGIDTEGGASVLGANDTVIGGGLSEANQGQTNQFHGLVHAYDTFQVDGVATIGSSSTNAHVVNGSLNLFNGPLNVFAGNGLQLKDAGNSFYAVLTNDGTNINTNGMPISAFSYKIGSTTVINSSGVLQASAFPALTGDVTTTAGALATTIPAGTVTLAKMANMATASLIYRKTAGSGAPEVNTLATLKTDLGLTGTNTGDQTITLTGGVTGSGTGSFATVVASVPAAAMPALTGDITTSAGAVSTAIAANAVTFAKFQQVAASSLVGNPTGSLANAQGITLAADHSFSGTTLQLGAFTGDIIKSAGSLVTALSTVNANTGSFGSATAVPVVTLDGKGRVTAASTATITTPAPSIQGVASAATVTPTFANDQVNVTAQAAALTLANPTGTAVDGKRVIVRIKDNGTAQTIAFGTQYRALGVTLPTTTVISKTLYLGLIWNAADTTFDVVAVNQQA